LQGDGLRLPLNVGVARRILRFSMMLVAERFASSALVLQFSSSLRAGQRN